MHFFRRLRINQKLDTKFQNWYKDCHYGDADTWNEAARCTGSANGVAMNKRPKSVRSRSGTRALDMSPVSQALTATMSLLKITIGRWRTMVKKNTYDNYIHFKKV